MNILSNLPLNTRRNYVMGTAKSGCEIYIPVHSNDETTQLHMRDKLQHFLNLQPDPPTTDLPEPPTPIKCVA